MRLDLAISTEVIVHVHPSVGTEYIHGACKEGNSQPEWITRWQNNMYRKHWNSDFKILPLSSVSQIMAPPSRESEERSKAAKHQSHLLRQSSSRRKLSLWPKLRPRVNGLQR